MVIDTVAEAEEAILEDDAYGQEVVVQLANGDRLSGEVTSEQKSLPYKTQWCNRRSRWHNVPLIILGALIGLTNLPCRWMNIMMAQARVAEWKSMLSTQVLIGPTHHSLMILSPQDFDAVGGDGWADGRWTIVDGNPMDCHGHGTHVAGTVASKDYGVAPDATIIGVRVLSCSWLRIVLRCY